MKHRYDNRGAGDEGEFAENLFKEACRANKQKFTESNLREDCAGVDGRFLDADIDIKSRKNRIPPNCCWIELAKAGGKLGSGWVYHNKLIGQLMVYEEDNHVVKVQFGIYQSDDLVALLKEKVDLNSKATVGKLYELYTRWFDGLHRGTMTVVTYKDLESLKSFTVLEVPQSAWGRIVAFYGYKGLK